MKDKLVLREEKTGDVKRKVYEGFGYDVVISTYAGITNIDCKPVAYLAPRITMTKTLDCCFDISESFPYENMDEHIEACRKAKEMVDYLKLNIDTLI